MQILERCIYPVSHRVILVCQETAQDTCHCPKGSSDNKNHTQTVSEGLFESWNAGGNDLRRYMGNLKYSGGVISREGLNEGFD